MLLNAHKKNKRNFSSLFGTAGGQGSDKDGRESLNGAVVGPVQANMGAMQQIHQKVEQANKSKGWPDGGINMPSKTDEDDSDDQNDWGGLLAALTSGELSQDEINELFSEDADVSYGPGNYPDDDTNVVVKQEKPEFFLNLLAEDKLKYTWLVPGVVAVGPHPLFVLHQDDLSEFKKAGFKAIVSVCDKPLDPKYVAGFHYRFSPTIQGCSSDLKSICEFIDTQEELGNPVYIHSMDSKGRAAAVLAAYFIHMGYLTGEEAISYVKQHYNKAILTTAQEKAVLEFALQS